MKLTTKDVCLLLNVTPMTVYQYRKGTPTKAPMPFELDGRNVWFNQKEVRAWAKENGVPLIGSGRTDSKQPTKLGKAASTKVILASARRRAHRTKDKG